MGQDVNQTSKTHQKGELFMYWGWNRAAFSSSDIQFSGDNYDFILEDVIAHDRHCLLYTSPSPRDRSLPRMPSSA